jgi:hypothetical protein
MSEFADGAMHAETLTKEDALSTLLLFVVFQRTILDLALLSVFAIIHFGFIKFMKVGAIITLLT